MALEKQFCKNGLNTGYVSQCDAFYLQQACFY